MSELNEVQELLIKENPNGEQEYRIINGYERLVTGSIVKLARFMSNNELFDITANGNSGKYQENGWRYATDDEVSMCLNEAKYLYAFESED